MKGKGHIDIPPLLLAPFFCAFCHCFILANFEMLNFWSDFFSSTILSIASQDHFSVNASSKVMDHFNMLNGIRHDRSLLF